MNHYELLGIRRDASVGAVKKAYQRKVKELSRLPGPQRTVQEKILKDAVAVLTDTTRRTDYDSRIEESDPLPVSTSSGTPLLVGLVVVALTAAGIGYFLFERSKDKAQMRMDERRAAEVKAEKDKRAPPAPAQR